MLLSLIEDTTKEDFATSFGHKETEMQSVLFRIKHDLTEELQR